MSRYKGVEQEEAEAREAILSLANAILAGDYPPLKGACELYYLANTAGLVDMEPFKPTLCMIETDCHDLPLFEDFRQKCSPAYLAESDERIASFESRVRPRVMEACRRIMSLYGRAEG